MMQARHKLLTVFAVLAGMMAIGSIALACTALVGPTEITDTDQTPSALDGDDTPGTPTASQGHEGGSVTATGLAVGSQEPSECGSGCDYEIVSVSNASASTCHFNDGDEDKKSEAVESALLGETELNGTVESPDSTGPAVVCFRSKETFSGSEAPAAGTSGAPFLVMD